MLTTPDAVDGSRALDPDNVHPDWLQTVAARSVLAVATYRPGRKAREVRCPLLVVVAEGDQSVLAAPAIRAARRAELGELVSVPGGHYAPFLEQHDRVATAEVDFLVRHLG